MKFCIKFDRQELFYEYEAHAFQKQSIELSMHSHRLWELIQLDLLWSEIDVLLLVTF
jgi:hypothetical protein